jgi:hypothetical protein
VLRELGDDAGAEHVGHLEDLVVDGVVRRDVGGEVAVQPGDRLLCGQREVFAHHRGHLVQPPVVRVEAVEERGDVDRVGVPAAQRVVQGGLVAGLGGGEHVHGDEDVVAQQVGELVGGVTPVERFERVADVGLVAQQPLGGRPEVRQVGEEADDRHPGPDDVVLPQLAHLVAELELRGEHDGPAGRWGLRCRRDVGGVVAGGPTGLVVLGGRGLADGQQQAGHGCHGEEPDGPVEPVPHGAPPDER